MSPPHFVPILSKHQLKALAQRVGVLANEHREVCVVADLNLIALSGVVTRDAVLREKSGGQVKAEFSFEVERPFHRSSGEPVSDLFLVDVWNNLGEWAIEHVKQGQRLFILGTLNKESYNTRAGREHLTIVKAKYLRPLQTQLLDGEIDVEQLKADWWPTVLLHTAVKIVDTAISEEIVTVSPVVADVAETSS